MQESEYWFYNVFSAGQRRNVTSPVESDEGQRFEGRIDAAVSLIINSITRIGQRSYDSMIEIRMDVNLTGNDCDDFEEIVRVFINE